MKFSVSICLAVMVFCQSACSRKKPGTAQRTPALSGKTGAAGVAGHSSNASSAGGMKTSYSQIPVHGPYISITFDDGPVPANTPRLLDMLSQRGIKATFFVVGNFAVRSPQILRRMVADGHEIANHTWTHGMLSSMSDSGVRSELTRSHSLVTQVTGAGPKMFRPPGGAITARQKNWIMGEYGYPCILWSLDPRDWQRPSAGGCRGEPWELTRRIVSQTKAGDIVLVHDLHASSVDAMPATLDGLLGKGFRFLTMSQLIAMGQTGRTPASSLAAAVTPSLAQMFSPGAL